MITSERLQEILDSDDIKFKSQGVDHKMKALSLLRERIPYDKCREIIGAAEHDKLYLCDIDEVIPYIDEADAIILSECNLFIDSECDCLSMFT